MKRRTLIVAGACGIPAVLLGSAVARAHGSGADAGIAAGGHRAVISGRVVAAEGTPLAGAVVTFRHADAIDADTSDAAAALARVATDADGRFCAVIGDAAGAGVLVCQVRHRACTSTGRIDVPSDGALAGRPDESGVQRSALQIRLA